MIAKNELMKIIKDMDSQLTNNIEVVAVGGTAMTLLELKESTIDIDFCISSQHKQEFTPVLDKKYRIDLFFDGYIFSEQLPKDYANKSKLIKKYKHITLKALSPEDIVITKSARLNARDEEDIKSIAPFVDKKLLRSRFNEVVITYAGNESLYRENFNYILEAYF